MNTPGTIAADAMRAHAEIPPPAAQAVPAGLAEPREVARAILFLACDKASLVAGALIMVDGGPFPA